VPRLRSLTALQPSQIDPLMTLPHPRHDLATMVLLLFYLDSYYGRSALGSTGLPTLTAQQAEGRSAGIAIANYAKHHIAVTLPRTLITTVGMR
jgi:hypothetical protein